MNVPDSTNKLFDRVAAILEQARTNVVRSVSSQIGHAARGRLPVFLAKHGSLRKKVPYFATGGDMAKSEILCFWGSAEWLSQSNQARLPDEA